MRGGPTVPLFAGASAGDTSSFGGAFTFHMVDHPSGGTWWCFGSANKYFKYKNKKTEYTILGILS